MYTTPPPMINNAQVYVSGDVSIDESAAIAPGVILQADSNSRILISRGVCIGLGTILHAREGILEIEPGVVLGAGVLIVGQGKVGLNACIGSGTTVLNSSIAPFQVLPAGSLIGDTSRPVSTDDQEVEEESPILEESSIEDQQGVSESLRSFPESDHGERKLDNPGDFQEGIENPEPEDPWDSQEERVSSESIDREESIRSQESPVSFSEDDPSFVKPRESSSQFSESPAVLYGQTQINQLLMTLFPHRKPLR